MEIKKIQEMWGETLYNAFADNIDENGYLVENWAPILEDNFSDWDDNMNDTHEKSQLYTRMYMLDFERNEDGTKVRPLQIR